MKTVDDLCIDAIRFLSVDQIEKAASGHPGLPLGAAPMAYVLWDRFLRHNPRNPDWFNRDRFILSAGHGSALLYSLLYLSGYELPIEELKRFRQLGSLTPGHPEHGLTPGVEATTGPLGQGFAMGVGMAIAEAHLAAVYNRPDHEVIDHRTFAIVSDGDLMEGISSEAASLAGRLELGKLVYLYDDNHISIEGGTALAFTENVAGRFEALGWQVLTVEEGNDAASLVAAIGEAIGETGRPSLIRVRTHIGFGSPKQDSADAHGAPLGADAVKATREAAGWDEKPFHVPSEVADHMELAVQRGAEWENEWNLALGLYRVDFPDECAELERRIRGELPEDWDRDLPAFSGTTGEIATRGASGTVLNAIAEKVPELMGGSADLGPSNKSVIKGSPAFLPGTYQGRNFHFGVREMAMGAAVNGMALHGGIRPYCSTFLVFSDYARPALRLAALMECPSLFIFTHDSFYVGEDGPTHQPVEQIASLRAIPNLLVFRPADANETLASWETALTLGRPACLVLTRQKLPVTPPEISRLFTDTAKGGYVLREANELPPDIVLVATGSEVSLAIEARSELSAKDVHARVVSLPCRELFEEQPDAYREKVLSSGIPRLVIEAGTTFGWEGYAGDDGAVIGLDHFGASAPANALAAQFGFTVERVVRKALDLLKR